MTVNKNDDAQIQTARFRRRLRRQSTTGANAGLARLCLDELNELSAAVVDRDQLLQQIGAAVLRRLNLTMWLAESVL